MTYAPHHDLHITAARRGLQVGAAVTSADGKHLGRIKELRGPYFRIGRRVFGHDRWLDVEEVIAAGESEIWLGVSGDPIDSYEVPSVVAADRRLEARADDLLDESELAEQRERMERQLHP
ncbi:MAG: hypothetical protein AB7N24_14465 [Dehalococcoidia bacterium]